MEPTSPRPAVHGLHHVTAISGDAQENLDFYTGTMGMRLVKKSINQDAPDTYHLFYADGAGTPGTDLTFFPWPDLPRARAGVGQVVEVPLAVPAGSLGFWQERLGAHGVSVGEVDHVGAHGGTARQGGRLGEPVAVDVHRRHTLGTAGHQVQHHGPADAVAAAGHHEDLAWDVHRLSLPRPPRRPPHPEQFVRLAQVWRAPVRR